MNQADGLARRWRETREGKRIAPSILSADFTRLADEVVRMERAGARLLHLDVMDGRFVPNITFGPPLVASLRGITELWLDAHLMIEDPLRYLPDFAKAGAESITVHVETGVSAVKLRDEADRLGVRLGLAIRPDTPMEATLDAIGEWFDLILVMSVMPGFGGQGYMPGSSERIAAAAQRARSFPRRPVIEVDGGIRSGTAGEASAAGADWLVAGHAIFRAPDPETAFRALQQEVLEPRNRSRETR